MTNSVMQPNAVKQLQGLSVALVYDHMVTRYGGAEVVLKSLHKLFPTAPIYTTVANSEQFKWIDQQQIKPSFLAFFI